MSLANGPFMVYTLDQLTGYLTRRMPKSSVTVKSNIIFSEVFDLLSSKA